MNIKQFIPKTSKGSPFAIADIHGCSKTFRNLVENKIQLNKNDQLFLLGDYINRGPDSKGVLDFILELKEQSFQVFSLRGNHEQMVLDYQSKSAIGTPSYLKKNGLFKNKQKEIDTLYQKFIEELPYFFETNDFYLVHAGFDFEAVKPFENTYAMMNISEIKMNKSFLNQKIIIKGHTPISIEETRKQIENREETSVICIDTGCFIKKKPFGKLVALNLDAWELLVQENID